VEEIRFTAAVIRGESIKIQTHDSEPVQEFNPGINYGQAKITWLISEIVRMRTAVLLGFSQSGFEYGGGLELVLGKPRGVELEFGVESISTMGTTGKLRLGWLAIRRIPMGASVEVTNFPANEGTGVRLLYNIGPRFSAVAQVSLYLGYQARTSVKWRPGTRCRMRSSNLTFHSQAAQVAKRDPVYSAKYPRNLMAAYYRPSRAPIQV
jgi:hypothetical protein